MREIHELPDKRLAHISALVHAITTELEEFIPYEVRETFCVRLEDVLFKNGMMLMGDDERAALGLEARDSQGWTYSERLQAKMDMRNALIMMIDCNIEATRIKP